MKQTHTPTTNAAPVYRYRLGDRPRHWLRWAFAAALLITLAWLLACAMPYPRYLEAWGEREVIERSK